MRAEPWLLAVLAEAAAASCVGVFVFGLGTSAAASAPRGDWRRAIGTSAVLSPEALLASRTVVMLVFLAMLVLRISEKWEGGYMLIYLTHWSLLVHSAHSVLIVLATVRAKQVSGVIGLSEDDAGDDRQPRIVSWAIAFSSLQLPLSLVVPVLYWCLVWEFWKLCAIGHPEPCLATPGTSNLFCHGFSTILIWISFLVGRVPYHLSNAGWFFLFFATFLVWTVAHFLLRVGKGASCSNFGYPDNECPIYDTLDWHYPWPCLRLFGGVLVLCPAIVAGIWSTGRGRDHLDQATATAAQARHRLLKTETELQARSANA